MSAGDLELLLLRAEAHLAGDPRLMRLHQRDRARVARGADQRHGHFRAGRRRHR